MIKRHSKSWKIVISMTLVVAMLFSSQSSLFALYKEEKARRQDAASIENSTLIIGTHLIHLSALTSELLTIAEQSAIDAVQDKRYYKSEMAEGTWFDITDAQSIADISTGGKPVDNKEINALMFTHNTKSDGITYRLDTGNAICIFDIVDPYDVNSIPELDPLSMHRDYVKGKEGNKDIGKKKISYMNQVINAEVKTDRTKIVDEEIAKLQVYLNVLKNNGANGENIDVVTSVMAQMDSERRSIVFEILATKLEKLSTKIMSELPEEEQGKFGDLLTPASDSAANVDAAYSEHLGKKLQAGINITTNERYRLSNELIKSAFAGDHTSCDQHVKNIINLDNVIAANAIDPSSELAYIEQSLEPDGISQFTAAVSKGESSEYRGAVSARSASVLLNQIRNTYALQVSSVRNELQSFVSAKIERISNADAKTYIEAKITQANTFYSKVKSDAFKEVCTQSIDDYLKFLQQKLKEILTAMNPSEVDALANEINKIRDEMLQALDGNDLIGAGEFEDKINDLNSKMNETNNNIAKTIAQDVSNLSDLKKQLSDERANPLNDIINSLNDDKQKKVSDILTALKDEIYVLGKQNDIANSGDGTNGDGTNGDGTNGDGTNGDGTNGDGTNGDGTNGDGTNGDGTNGDGTSGSGTSGNALTDKIAQLENQVKALTPYENLTAGEAVDALSKSNTQQMSPEELDKLAKQVSDLEQKIIADEAGQGTVGNISDIINELKTSSLSIINTNGDKDLLNANIENLKNMLEQNSKLVFPVLKETNDAMIKKRDVNGDKSFTEEIKEVESLIAENKDAYDSAIQGKVDMNKINGIIGNFFKDLLDRDPSLTANDKLVIELLALDRLYSDTQDTALNGTIITKAQSGLNNKNPLVFYKLEGKTEQYAAISAVAYKADYRYIWRSTKRIATLADGAKFYEFTIGSDTAIKEEGKDKMFAKIEMQKEAYIIESYITEQFKLYARNLQKTKFAVLYDTKILGYSLELYDLIKL